MFYCSLGLQIREIGDYFKKIGVVQQLSLLYAVFFFVYFKIIIRFAYYN